MSQAKPVEGLQGWWESQWMGFYSAESYPWIYHQNLGWVFVSMESHTSTWFYHQILGWLWTSPDLFPYLFLSKRDQWYYLDQTTPKTTIYDYQEREWFEPDTPVRILAKDESQVGGKVTGYGYYYRWDPVILEAKAGDNYNFAGWSGDITSRETIIEFEALRNLTIDASFTAIPVPSIPVPNKDLVITNPSSKAEVREVLKNAHEIINGMDHLSTKEKDKSMAEFLIFGKSPTSGLSVTNK